MKRLLLSTLAAAALVALPLTSPAYARGGGHGGGGGHAGGGHMGGGHAGGFGGHAGGFHGGGGHAGSYGSYGHAVTRGSTYGHGGAYGHGGYGGHGHGGYYGHGGYGGGYYGGYYGGVYPGFGLDLGWGYDPFWYGDDGFDYPYAYPDVAGPADGPTGGLRLEVAPKSEAKQAQVFVDGYYSGVVDDFNGHFQHLNLPPGAHHVVVQAPGFAPLTFDTYIRPDHTTDFRGAMQPAPAPGA